MPKKVFLCCFATSILLFSCGNKQEIKPAITESQMIEILADCYLAESSVRTIDTPLKVEYIKTYYQEIFAKHGVSEEQFTESYNYYCYDLEKADKIYEKVLEKLYI